MKRTIQVLFLAHCALAVLAGAETPRESAAVDELSSWPVPSTPIPVELGALHWELPEGARLEGDTLVAEIPPERPATEAMATARLDLSAYPGHRVVFHIHARGEGIGTPPVSYKGLKFMARLEETSGKRHWPGVPHRTGDWEADLELVCEMSGMDLREALLVLGLQECPGRVVFDLSTLRAEDCGESFPLVNQGYRVRYPESRPGSPARSRGAMLSTNLDRIAEDDFVTLEEWGANLVRFQIAKDWKKVGGWERNEDYDAYLDGALDVLEHRILPWAGAHGIRVVVDLHATPGARNAREENRMFYEKRYADHFVLVWERIARRFQGDRRIYGYDLVNEPLQRGPAPYSYLHLQRAAALAIRAIDPDVTVIVAANGYGKPEGFKTLSPLAMDNVMYQTHCYMPAEFTHQGVFDGRRKDFVPYPDPEKGWDKEYVRATLAPVLEFSRRHGARIFIGEFSAIAWAPGAENYLRDCIDIFEEYGWDWCYHAFREWDGWNVEKEWTGTSPNGYDMFAPVPDSPRKRALLEGLRR